MKRLSYLGLGFAALVLVSLMYAQIQPIITIQVPFQFAVGKIVLPAGQYRISELGEASIKVESMKTTKAELAPILTRLANQSKDTSVAVFDKIGDRYVLSEIWIGGFDGFLVSSTTEKHQHEIIKAGRRT